MDEDHFFLEEEFFSHDRKAQKREKKIAQSKDRSKYKQSNIDQKKKQQKKSFDDKDTIQGRVLSISKDGIIVDADQQTYTCTLKGSLKHERTKEKNLIAVGDFVIFKPLKESQGQILSIENRFSYLAREDATGKKQQLIAVNIDQVFIVTSVVEPTLKPHLLDRYIIAAKKGNMSPIILINKTDLLDKDAKEKKRTKELLKIYKSIEIPIFSVSALCKKGVSTIKKLMLGKTSVFSGQSGVGKSSLLNASLGLHLKTGTISTKNHKGSHVTTKAELIRINDNSFCIDTPGIKSFGIWDLSFDEVLHYFSEIAELAPHCRFPNCTHLHEPDCAVQKAVEENDISHLRFESYRSLMTEVQTQSNY